MFPFVMSPEPSLPAAAGKNLEIIARVEQQLLHKQSSLERMGRSVARFFGSAGFLLPHAILLAAWIALNVGVRPSVRPFDPYPFPFLSLLVGAVPGPQARDGGTGK